MGEAAGRRAGALAVSPARAQGRLAAGATTGRGLGSGLASRRGPGTGRRARLKAAAWSRALQRWRRGCRRHGAERRKGNDPKKRENRSNAPFRVPWDAPEAVTGRLHTEGPGLTCRDSGHPASLSRAERGGPGPRGPAGPGQWPPTAACPSGAGGAVEGGGSELFLPPRATGIAARPLPARLWQAQSDPMSQVVRDSRPGRS